MTLVQTEPKKIVIWQNVEDMQWPCPTGFHVPTQTERWNIISLLSTLGITTWNNMKLYLKLPFAWIVYGTTSWDKQYLNVYWSYYTSYPAYESWWINRVKWLQIDTSNINNDYSPTRNTALPIRPFKNIPSIPDWSRTALYSDKIYHNSTLWLISISDDGANRITIADKNLWATVVYNDGDTLSEANCGKYYQWWNNYGFPFTWAVTTSSTQVDASNYWPWNYYSSSTFISNNTNYDWSSVSNPNLRWWATKEIKRITIRPNGTEKQIRPEISWWSMDDSFPWTSLDTTLWTATRYWWTGSYSVNNGLSMSKSSGRWWYAVYTNKTFEWTESEITIECSISAEWWSYRETMYNILWITSYTDASSVYFTPNNLSFQWCQSSTYSGGSFKWQLRTWATTMGSVDNYASRPNTPYTVKYVIDVPNWTSKLYLNWTLVKTATLYGTKNTAIWQPLFSIACISRTSISCTISNVKINVI